MRTILERVNDDKESISRASLRVIEELGESKDKIDEEMFKFRMGMRNYLKELKMNIERIQKSKNQ